jgi:hypothetical protein
MTERHPRTMKIYALSIPLSRQRERAGVRVDMISSVFPLTAAFPASGSGQRAIFGRHPYFYIEERERHPVFPDLCKAERDLSSPQGERKIVFIF